MSFAKKKTLRNLSTKKTVSVNNEDQKMLDTLSKLELKEIGKADQL